MNLVYKYRDRYYLKDGFHFAICVDGGEGFWTEGLENEILIICKEGVATTEDRYMFFKEDTIYTRFLDAFKSIDDEGYKRCPQKILIILDRSVSRKPHGWDKYLERIGKDAV